MTKPGYIDYISLVNNFNVQVARGKIPGYAILDKWGQNSEIDNGVSADIWDGGNTADVSLLWVPPTQARIHQLVSTSVSDTGSCTIYGLKTWDSRQTSEVVTMNGTTNVPTANSYVIIHRMIHPANVGTITATADTDATITAQIGPLNGQTRMAIVGVSSLDDAFVTGHFGTLNKGSGGVASGYIDLEIHVNDDPGNTTNYRTLTPVGLSLEGTSHYTHCDLAPMKFEGPAIIKMQGRSATNNMDITAGFSGYLVDKDAA